MVLLGRVRSPWDCTPRARGLGYGQGYPDLLFQVISQRYQRRSTIVSTNRVFNEWSEVFPNTTSIIALIDRLCHNAEIISIDADSYGTRRPATATPPARPPAAHAASFDPCHHGYPPAGTRRRFSSVPLAGVSCC